MRPRFAGGGCAASENSLALDMFLFPAGADGRGADLGISLHNFMFCASRDNQNMSSFSSPSKERSDPRRA